MPYRVELSFRATPDLEQLFIDKRAGDSAAAPRWFDGLERAVLGLADRPCRCPLAPEGKQLKLPLRELLYGRRRDTYRVIYKVEL